MQHKTPHLNTKTKQSTVSTFPHTCANERASVEEGEALGEVLWETAFPRPGEGEGEEA
jgi:hypothetical protein